MKCFYTFMICFSILCSFSLEAQGGKTIEQIEAERKKESPKTKKTRRERT